MQNWCRLGILYKFLFCQFVISLCWFFAAQIYIVYPHVSYLKSEDDYYDIYFNNKSQVSPYLVSNDEGSLLKEKVKNQRWNTMKPWEPPPQGLYNDDDTGSKENCTNSQIPTFYFNTPSRWDSGEIIISCQKVRYRAPKWKFKEVGPLIFGVLSSASGTGPERRRYIRSTWANDVHGCFFIVAGPWDAIEKEYMFYQDIIWIDHEEIYEGEISVLTYKTISYFSISHILAKRPEDGGFIHAVKTDDDSYVNVAELQRMLLGKDGNNTDYWGHCPEYKVAPLRDPKLKWSITYKTYPEPMFPLYCQGAGFGLSRHLLDCAVGNHHVSNFRYIPFEDVAIGIIVERCGKKPSMTDGVNVFRADTADERKRVMHNVKVSDTNWLPPPNIKGKYIQHRVETEQDMLNHHLSLKLKPTIVKTIPVDFFPLKSNEENKIRGITK